MTRYVYHYNASVGCDGKTLVMDGLLSCDTPIVSMSLYERTRNVIAGEGGVDVSGLVVHSLTLLHQMDEEEEHDS